MNHFYRDLFFRITLPALAYGYVGWWFGSKIVAIPNVQFFKVLNVVGLTFDLAGILILSHFVAGNAKLQKFIATQLTEHVLAFLISAVIGMLTFSKFGGSGPSEQALENMAIGLLFAVVAPMINFVCIFIAGLDRLSPWSNETRCKLFGLLLVTYGVLIQLYAAWLDLHQG